MDEHRERFIRLTPESEDGRDWKDRLLKPGTGSTLRLDTAYLGGQVLADIVTGHVSESTIDPQVIEAYQLQYPELSKHFSFVNEVRKLAGDSDRLRGLFGGVKGKLFELEYRDYLNDGHLPTGYVAELSAKANQPGVDILIRDSKGIIHNQIQAKAVETLLGVKEHLEQYPELTPVIIPADQVRLANSAGLGHYVDGAPMTEHDLDQTVNHAIDQAGSHVGIHLPLVGFSLLAGEMAYLMWKGKPVSFKQVLKRGAKMTVAAITGQVAYLLSHSFWVGVPITITTRALMERYSESKNLVDLLGDKRTWCKKWASSTEPLTL